MKRSFILTSLLIAITILVYMPKSVNAQELRTYMHTDVTVWRLDAQPLSLKLVPFVKIENRFQEKGLVLNKIFSGMKLSLFPWLATQFYYAHKDLYYTNHKQKHMVVGDILFAYDGINSLRLLDRIGNEWHVSDGFYRLRNYTELLYETPVEWLGLWIAEEFRFDSDQTRINMNDVRAGLQFSPLSKLRLKIFYDLELKHRNRTDWSKTHFVGVAVLVHL